MTFQMSFAPSDKATLLLVLLVAGHVFGDFLFQSRRLAEKKERSLRSLLVHGVIVLVTHVGFLIPFLSVAAVLWAMALAAAHTLQDALRIRLWGERGRSVSGLLADQAIHVLMIIAVWWVLYRSGAQRDILLPSPTLWMPTLRHVAVLSTAYVFCVWGGSMIVEKALGAYPGVNGTAVTSFLVRVKGDLLVVRRKNGTEEEPPPGDHQEGDGPGAMDYTADRRMGMMIGRLERALALTLLLYGQWGALGLVLAAKSIARFKELESQSFSDYYLIGTLWSILVAVATGILAREILF